MLSLAGLGSKNGREKILLDSLVFCYSVGSRKAETPHISLPAQGLGNNKSHMRTKH